MCARAPDWANQEPRHYFVEQEEEEWGKSGARGPKEEESFVNTEHTVMRAFLTEDH